VPFSPIFISAVRREEGKKSTYACLWGERTKIHEGERKERISSGKGNKRRKKRERLCPLYKWGENSLIHMGEHGRGREKLALREGKGDDRLFFRWDLIRKEKGRRHSKRRIEKGKEKIFLLRSKKDGRREEKDLKGWIDKVSSQEE